MNQTYMPSNGFDLMLSNENDNSIFKTSDKAMRFKSMIESTDFNDVRGKVTQALGTIIRASIKGVKIGELCRLVDPVTHTELFAEVIGFSKQDVLLTPIGELDGLSLQTQVIACGRSQEILISEQMLGRVVNGIGVPIDGGKPITHGTNCAINAPPPNPMSRKLIDRPISTGVRAIDGLLTCGEGQRLGIFASAGGGKSTLLSMITKGCDADIIVIALIGERGREVREFIERELGEEGLKKSIIVAATSDRPAMERVKAAYAATTIAEHFRDQGKRVLLLMDSITRFARALREIGLAAGEPPARRGFPPSVFATLPKLLERSGCGENGSITALYTVLVEGDDLTEPVADEVRSILDGHIILSRSLAESGHYPAIDILASTSRVMNSITTDEHQTQAIRVRQLLAKYKEIELLVKIGEYKNGADPLADQSLNAIEEINHFLRQPTKEVQAYEQTLQKLSDVAGL
jgi:type III secretion protein N (ATPase)